MCVCISSGCLYLYHIKFIVIVELVTSAEWHTRFLDADRKFSSSFGTRGHATMFVLVNIHTHIWMMCGGGAVMK